jgi:hypothetical protein
MVSLTKKSLANLVKETQKRVLGGKDFSLFGITRGIFLPQSSDLGQYKYTRDKSLEIEFNRPLKDTQFAELGYTDYIAGPVKPTNSCGFSSWENEIEHALRMKEPENLIYYVRQDVNILASRVLIPIADFYGGLTDEEAIVKYGKRLWKKMTNELTGVTVSKDKDGKVRIPFRDLNYAHKKATGKKTHPEEWD